MKLLLIRHAQSQGNFEGRLQGRKEFPLTELGLSQASALAERLSDARLAAVYSSPIRRAYDTAARVAERIALETIVEPRIQEYDFGDLLSGLTWPEIREKQPEIVEALISNDSEFPRYPGEEGRKAFHERVCAAMAEITARHRDSEAVAVVAHAGPIVVYLLETLGRKYSRPVPFRIENASISTVELAREPTPYQPGAVVTGINDTCHLNGLSS
jgi:broad specificity phosphatase PhoE